MSPAVCIDPFFLNIELPELIVEFHIATRKDKDIVQRGRPRNGYINPFPELSWILVLQEPPVEDRDLISNSDALQTMTSATVPVDEMLRNHILLDG